MKVMNQKDNKNKPIILIMWRMQMIDNYANLHDYILSDALVMSTTKTGHIIKL